MKGKERNKERGTGGSEGMKVKDKKKWKEE